MKREQLDSIGFANRKQARSAEKMVRTGVGIVIGGALLVAAGFKRIYKTRCWYELVNDGGKEAVQKLYDIVDSNTID